MYIWNNKISWLGKKPQNSIYNETKIRARLSGSKHTAEINILFFLTQLGKFSPGVTIKKKTCQLLSQIFPFFFSAIIHDSLLCIHHLYIVYHSDVFRIKAIKIAIIKFARNLIRELVNRQFSPWLSAALRRWTPGSELEAVPWPRPGRVSARWPPQPSHRTSGIERE